MIWHRKREWLGHILTFLRHEGFLHDIIEGKVMDKPTRGRKGKALLHDIIEGREGLVS